MEIVRGTTSPPALSFERRGSDLCVLIEETFNETRRQGLASVANERGLGVKCIDMRRAAVHEQKNHPFRARGEVRIAHGEWISLRGGGRPGQIGKDRSESEIAEAARAAL